MNRFNFNIRVAIAGCAVLALSSLSAYAGPGEESEHGHRRMAPLLSVLQPEQRKQVHAIFMSDRSRLDLLHAQVRDARQALISKLLSPDKTVDVSAEVAKLKQVQGQLIDERIKLALEARKIMSPEQRAKASALWVKWRSLREQERSLLEEARNASHSESTSSAGAPAQPQSSR